MTTPICLPFVSGEAAVFSAKNPHGSVNEDGAALIALAGERGVLAVADGLGGQPKGDQAAALTLQALQSSLSRSADAGGELRNAIIDGIERANHDVQALGVGAATTLVVAEIQGRTLRTYHIGDSAILVVGQRGRRKLQTVPHSPVGYAVEAGVIDESDALHHDELHLISNLVGADDMRIEMGSPLELSPRDTVLLATDGLLDNLSIDEIVDHIRKGSLSEASLTLVETTRKRMAAEGADHPSKPDDLTFIAFRSLIGRE